MRGIKTSSGLSFGQESYINRRTSMAGSLFGSIDSGSSSMLGNFSVSDWGSIRNGSYGKLVKATYAKREADTKSSAKSDSSTKGSKRKYTKYEKSGALDKMLSTYDPSKDIKAEESKDKSDGDKSVSMATAAKNLSSAVKDIEKLETDDMNVAADAMQKFVDAYNTTLKSGRESDISTVSRNIKWMTGTTDSRKDKLAEVGISINSDKTLSFDKEAFKQADPDTINSLFAADNPNTLYADSYIAEIGVRADKIAEAAASKGTSESSYNSKGSYNASSSGNALDWSI